MPPKSKQLWPHPPPPADTLHSLTLLVGQIAGKLESHIDAVTVDRAEREDDRRESAKYRHDIREKLDALKDKIGAVAGHADKITALEKTAADYKSFRNRVAGGLVLAGVIWPLAVDWLKRKFFA